MISYYHRVASLNPNGRYIFSCKFFFFALQNFFFFLNKEVIVKVHTGYVTLKNNFYSLGFWKKKIFGKGCIQFMGFKLTLFIYIQVWLRFHLKSFLHGSIELGYYLQNPILCQKVNFCPKMLVINV